MFSFTPKNRRGTTKHTRRSSRALSIEHLEDRLVPSGGPQALHVHLAVTSLDNRHDLDNMDSLSSTHYAPPLTTPPTPPTNGLFDVDVTTNKVTPLAYYDYPNNIPLYQPVVVAEDTSTHSIYFADFGLVNYSDSPDAVADPTIYPTNPLLM